MPDRSFFFGQRYLPPTDLSFPTPHESIHQPSHGGGLEVLYCYRDLGLRAAPFSYAGAISIPQDDRDLFRMDAVIAGCFIHQGESIDFSACSVFVGDLIIDRDGAAGEEESGRKPLHKAPQNALSWSVAGSSSLAWRYRWWVEVEA